MSVIAESQRLKSSLPKNSASCGERLGFRAPGLSDADCARTSEVTSRLKELNSQFDTIERQSRAVDVHLSDGQGRFTCPAEQCGCIQLSVLMGKRKKDQ